MPLYVGLLQNEKIDLYCMWPYFALIASICKPKLLGTVISANHFDSHEIEYQNASDEVYFLCILSITPISIAYC
ncbi:hypothetical protein KAM329D_37750 [Aeromonas caviae]|nr:hypothetical protein KAM329_47390 [Aeromonas caviae]GJA15544.1 hypothetical protein KAM335_27400 [Aeromonas caviae]GJA25353.1 hypothetical protein KAM337_38810 [Aeromonas caviae]GJC24794.1 hypothetical protein KAM329D_37750 [Aeromonas caviae]